MHHLNLKKTASERIRGRYRNALFLSFLTLFFSCGAGVCSWIMARIAEKSGNTAWSLPCQCVLLLCGLWISSSLRQGTYAWYTAAAFGKKPSFIQPLFWLRRGRGFTAIPVRIRVHVRKFLCFLVMTIPGLSLIVLAGYEWFYKNCSSDFFYVSIGSGMICIILGLFFAALYCQRYSLIPLLLSLEPSKRSGVLLRESRYYMENRHLRTLFFKITQTPLILLCLFIIPIAYALPMYRMRLACYHAQIYKEGLRSTDFFANKNSRNQDANA